MAKPQRVKNTFNALLASNSTSLSCLKPTQLAAGMREVEHKQKFLRGLGKRLTALGEYCVQRPILVVRGPEDGIYVIDHHHLALALTKENYDVVPIRVERDFSDATMEEFWERMQEAGFLHLYDENGRKKSIADLPDNLTDMKDDPYRSLAWFVREAGGYNKTEAPYVEFQWAEYFRKHIDLATVTESFDKAYEQALKLARDPAAKNLPGYKGPVSSKSVDAGVPGKQSKPVTVTH